MRRILTVGLAVAVVFLAGYGAHAQVSRSYRNGSTWNLSFLRMKPGIQGYRERLDRREIIGDRLAREIILEPRP